MDVGRQNNNRLRTRNSKTSGGIKTAPSCPQSGDRIGVDPSMANKTSFPPSVAPVDLEEPHVVATHQRLRRHPKDKGSDI
jgi:hypothetical protein